MTEVLKDFPPGPLDLYRQKASFDWKKLKVFLRGEDEVRHLHEVHEELKRYPEFLPSTKPLTFDEERQLTFKQTAIIRANEDKLFNDKYKASLYYCPSGTGKYGLTIDMFTGVIKSIGSKRHAHFLDQVKQGKISGCFCLTEVGHGSNVKGMRTRATYDKATKQFVVHSPDFQAAKCWIGGLGNTATHALLYAQLYLDNKNYGLHTFVVPIRDPETLLPFPGITVGDMGEKMGLNGVDNGFIIFNNYRIPRENLLNKNGDVTEHGEYVTPFEDDNKRFGASLMALSNSRVGVFISVSEYGGHALTIAVRYAGVRKQFGPANDEQPILEYQTHQYRLLPYVASTYVLTVSARKLHQVFENYVLNPHKIENVDLLGAELHILTAAAKPVSGWIMRDAIQSSREACAGHGYLKAAGIADVKNCQEASLTFEGENWVLIQQVSNSLLKIWSSIRSGVEVSFPLKSTDFLNDGIKILETGKFSVGTVEELCKPEAIFKIYQWLACYLLKQTSEKLILLKRSGASQFSAKNDSQVFYARKLGIVYIEHFFLQQFLEKIQETTDSSIRSVLLNMFSLYGLYSLEKFLSILYQGGYASGEQPAILIQDGIIELCSKLKNDAVALVDVIAPPDFILNSVLGASDGQVYERLENSFRSSPYGVERPSWWKDIVNWKDIVPKPKL